MRDERREEGQRECVGEELRRGGEAEVCGGKDNGQQISDVWGKI